jgi:lipid A ethanolaminephosphotransferase
LYARLRGRVSAHLSFASDVRFALAVSLLWATLYNFRFWHETFAHMWQPTAGATLFIVSLFVLVVSVQAILLLLAPTRALLRIAASFLFVLASLSSYFSSAYGAIMNKDMMRNVAQTDPAEVGGLVSADLLLHLVLLGFLPALLVWWVRLPPSSLGRQWRQRAVFIAGALTASTVALFACSANYAVFLREYKPIRFTLSPTAPLTSTIGLLADARKHRNDHQPLLNPAGESRRITAPGSRPLVVFVVIGETARAADFQLGGYERPTNPQLTQVQDLAYFRNATACGTSTAISVPCMFSGFERTAFDVDQAGRYTNLLDSLSSAGLAVEWRDNNAGCKGVCERVQVVDYSSRPDASLCPQSYCYDEVMLSGLADRLQNLQHDTVIVFHQIGSHGPAYSERYPPQFEKFKPACHSHQLERCTTEEVRNAYDNTIAYTDYVLSKQIALLRAAEDHVDSVLLYASDHGESLGEQGIYLHGLPWSFAPGTQTDVPMLMWTSRGYEQRARLRPDCLQEHGDARVSHDNLYHTVLGAAEVRNRVYDARLDLLAACRDHE